MVEQAVHVDADEVAQHRERRGKVVQPRLRGVRARVRVRVGVRVRVRVSS